MDTHEIAKVQRLEEQLDRVTPEEFYEPCSVLKLEVEDIVLETSEDEQHLRDFGGRKWSIKILKDFLINKFQCHQDQKMQKSWGKEDIQNPVLGLVFVHYCI